MNVVRFEPWSVANLLWRDLTHLDGRRADFAQDETGRADWVPTVDIIEKKDHFALRADLPGVKPEDIEISMEGGILTVSGERRVEPRDDDDGMRRVERVSGHFYRRFTLPDTTDSGAIKATTSNGILEVSIPKLPEVEARRITVEAA